MSNSCCTVNSPIGSLHLESNGSSLTQLRIEGKLMPRDAGHECSPSPDRVLKTASKQLGEYFAGKRKTFDVPLDVRGTDFQVAIWSQLSKIPFGEVRGYGQLGASVGKPTASRAVGGCVGANPIAVIIPCHRVLASDSRITGFSGGDGISTKQWLLDHEGIAYRD